MAVQAKGFPRSDRMARFNASKVAFTRPRARWGCRPNHLSMPARLDRNAQMNRRERRANRGAAQSPAGLCEEAAAHLRAGRLLDAQMRCEQALAADPAHADSLHLMGLLSLQSQQYDHAVEWISRAIQQNPKHGYLVSLGTTLRRQASVRQAANRHTRRQLTRRRIVLIERVHR